MLTLSVSACALAWDSADAEPGIRITWNLYSGRPSPEWRETDTFALEQIRYTLSGLPPAREPYRKEVELGNTFSIWAYEKPVPENFPMHVDVYNGIIRVVQTDGAEPKYLKDEKGLHAYLTSEVKRRKLKQVEVSPQITSSLAPQARNFTSRDSTKSPRERKARASEKNVTGRPAWVRP